MSVRHNKYCTHNPRTLKPGVDGRKTKFKRILGRSARLNRVMSPSRVWGGMLLEWGVGGMFLGRTYIGAS